MFPRQPTLQGNEWGDFWFVTREPNGPRLYETNGSAILLQLQAMLRDGALPGDPTYDGSRIARTPIVIDGVWGPDTMKRLWAYGRAQGTLTPAELEAISGYGRTRQGQYLPRVLKTSLRLLYFSPVLNRAAGTREDPPTIVEDANIMMPHPSDLPPAGPIAPTNALFTAEPSDTAFDGSLPNTGHPVLEAVRTPGGGPERSSGPWTLAVGERSPLGTIAPPSPPSGPAPQVPAKTGSGPQPGKGAETPAPVAEETQTEIVLVGPQAASSIAAQGGFLRTLSGISLGIVRHRYFVPAVGATSIVAGVGLIVAARRRQAGAL